MTVAVLTAVDHRHEADLVARLEGRREVDVVRRCADVAELLSVAATGRAEMALVSGGFLGVDREVIRALAGHGVGVVGVVASADEAGERALRQLGVRIVVSPEVGADELIQALGGEGASPWSGAAPWSGAGALGAEDGWSAGVLGSMTGGSGEARAGSDRSAEGPAGLGSPERVAGLSGHDAVGGVPDSGATGSGASRDATSSIPVRSLEPCGPGEGVPPREPQVPGLVIAVWGPIGSPGRTTVAVTLAAVLADRGVSTLLVDADTHGASIAQVLGLIDEAPGVAAAARLSDQGVLDVPALSRVSPEVSAGLRVLTGLPRADRWPELRPGAVADVLRVARLLTRVVVVDCGYSLEDDEELSYDTAAPRRNGATLTVLADCDLLVAVGSADPVGLQRLVRGVRDLDDRPGPSPLVAVNKVRASTAGPHPERDIADVLRRFSGLTDLYFLPWSPAECDAALWSGRSLVESAPQSPLTLAVAALADALVVPAVPGSRGATAKAPRRRLGARSR